MFVNFLVLVYNDNHLIKFIESHFVQNTALLKVGLAIPIIALLTMINYFILHFFQIFPLVLGGLVI